MFILCRRRRAQRRKGISKVSCVFENKVMQNYAAMPHFVPQKPSITETLLNLNKCISRPFRCMLVPITSAMGIKPNTRVNNI